jgi:6-phosphogluconolactonase/glucosamine-6-phosphate isomerase/deaminase
MFEKVSLVLQQERILAHLFHGVLLATVRSEEEGISLATKLLYSLVDTRTVLYLSGGRTPKQFYQQLAGEEKLIPACVGLVDERYGMPRHENSNERMIAEAGLLRYLQMRDIRFHDILQPKFSREEAALSYDGVVRQLHSTFPHSVGVLGIGSDGHTAGIAGNREDFTNPLFSQIRRNLLVSEFDDKNGFYKERITMTFLGLSLLDVLVVLVFGEDKRTALAQVFSEGSEEEVPGRFYKRGDIARKTIFITTVAL